MLIQTILGLCALFSTSIAVGVEQQIINGNPAPEGRWPWQGAWLDGGSFSCGCVLVHKFWVITAAHCVGTGDVGTYTLEFGSVTRGSGVIYTPDSIIRHPNYDDGITPGSYPNDVAVVHISGTGADLINPNIAPVTDGIDSGIDRTSQNCWITGWGRTCAICGISTNLLEVQIPVIDDATCYSRHNTSYNPAVHVCVWDSVNTNIGACNGDSGGPLVCRATINDNFALVGVTSWGRTGCNPDWPTVYTRLSSFKTWICETTNNDVC